MNNHPILKKASKSVSFKDLSIHTDAVSDFALYYVVIMLLAAPVLRGKNICAHLLRSKLPSLIIYTHLYIQNIHTQNTQ